MAEVLYYAIPFFVALLVVEYLSYRHDHDDEAAGYDLRDTRTSLTMGLGNVAINVVWKFAVVAIYAALYELTPLRIPADAWWAWVALFFADDLAYYWFHRVSHESRFFWASHVVHHSSQHYNLSTALRQTWVPMTYLLNTPSHHRVHHGSNHDYLDRNYGGILIVWDKLFGTYVPEGERVRYGLTKNLDTHHPVKVAFHEYAALWRDVRIAPSWRVRLGHLWHGPGWRPEPAAEGAQPPGG